VQVCHDRPGHVGTDAAITLLGGDDADGAGIHAEASPAHLAVRVLLGIGGKAVADDGAVGAAVELAVKATVVVVEVFRQQAVAVGHEAGVVAGEAGRGWRRESEGTVCD
jgi:hypothetical protein